MLPPPAGCVIRQVAVERTIRPARWRFRPSCAARRWFGDRLAAAAPVTLHLTGLYLFIKVSAASTMDAVSIPCRRCAAVRSDD